MTMAEDRALALAMLDSAPPATLALLPLLAGEEGHILTTPEVRIYQYFPTSVLNEWDGSPAEGATEYNRQLIVRVRHGTHGVLSETTLFQTSLGVAAGGVARWQENIWVNTPGPAYNLFRSLFGISPALAVFSPMYKHYVRVRSPDHLLKGTAGAGAVCTSTVYYPCFADANPDPASLGTLHAVAAGTDYSSVTLGPDEYIITAQAQGGLEVTGSGYFELGVTPNSDNNRWNFYKHWGSSPTAITNVATTHAAAVMARNAPPPPSDDPDFIVGSTESYGVHN